MEKVETLRLQPNGNIPNNQHLPLLLYRQVFVQGEQLEKQFKELFKQNNWGGTWVNGVFDYHHYHSKSHEVLGVAGGSAILMLGGPDGHKVEVALGDVVVLPAGTGHCLISATAGFKVVGSYPKGQENYDICTEKDDLQEKLKNIEQTALPTTDPISGTNGPLMQRWVK